MKKLIISIFCLTVITVSGQRTLFNLQSLISKDVTHKTTKIAEYKKWKMDPSIQTAYIDDKIELTNYLFVRTAPDTVIVLEHNTMDEWYVRVQYIHSDADQMAYTVDATGKVLEKTRPFTGIVRGSDDGSIKIWKVVDKIDLEVSVEHVTQVLSSGEEGKNIQREVDELLSKF